MSVCEAERNALIDDNLQGLMEVLTEEKAAAEVTDDHLGLLCEGPPPEASERPPVVSLESCGRYLQRFPESSFIWYLRSCFIVLLGLCVVRLIFELRVSLSVLFWGSYRACCSERVVADTFGSVAVVTVVFVGKKYAHLARQCCASLISELF